MRTLLVFAAAAIVLVVALILALARASPPEIVVPSTPVRAAEPESSPPRVETSMAAPAPAEVEAPSARVLPEIVEAPAASVAPDRAGTVYGVIQDPDHRPIARADVVLWIHRFGAREFSARAVTDDDGSYRFDLAVPLELAARARRDAALRRKLQGEPEQFTINARAPGFQRASYTRECETARAAGTRMDITLQRGSIVIGLVLASRRAVARATVQLFDETSNESQTTMTETDGSYWFASEPLHRYRVFARKEGVGARASDPFVSPVLLDHRAEDLVLEGDGTIEGSVEYPDGRVAASVALRAIPEDHTIGEIDALSIEKRAELEARGGLLDGRTASDAFGFFTLRGLKPGRYTLRFDELTDDLSQPRERFSAPSTSKVRLVYPDYRLRVLVQWWDAYEDEPSDALPPGVQVSCALVRSMSSDAELFEVQHTSRGGGAEYFLVIPGNEYRVRAVAPGVESAAKLVTASPARFETEIHLTLGRPSSDGGAETDTPETRARGSIRVTGFDAVGEKTEDWAVTLFDAKSDARVSGFDPATIESHGRVSAVPPGAYTLRAERRHAASAWIVPPQPTARFEVDAGVETRVTLVLRRGGRVRLALDRALESSSRSGSEVSAADTARTLAAPIGVVAEVLSTSDAPPIAVLEFSDVASGRPASGERTWLGARGVCEPVIPPGSYVLRCRAAGFEPRELPLAIRGGETTEITVELAPVRTQ